jgi:hypothetical protein
MLHTSEPARTTPSFEAKVRLTVAATGDTEPSTDGGTFEPPFDPTHWFWRHVRWEGPDACARYQGPGSRGPYGHVRVRDDQGRQIFAPRLAWSLFGLGPISGILCHLCDISDCVAVWAGHLIDGDHHLNARHRDDRGRRQPLLALGEHNASAKLTAREVEAIHRARDLGVSVKVLAASFRISTSSLYNVLNLKHYAVHKPQGVRLDAN